MAMHKGKESALNGNFHRGISRSITLTNSNVVGTHCDNWLYECIRTRNNCGSWVIRIDLAA
jgi:hypothetical protein